MTRIPMLAIAMMTVTSAALAQSNLNPGATPNTGVSTVGPTYSAPGNQGGATPSPGMGGTFTGPGGTTGASPSVGAATGAGPPAGQFEHAAAAEPDSAQFDARAAEFECGASAGPDPGTVNRRFS